MNDLISRQEVLNAIGLHILGKPLDREVEVRELLKLITKIYNMPSAQPEIPPYVAEIEAEYKKLVNVPYIRKPLAKALCEVWKKHDREDAERETDG